MELDHSKIKYVIVFAAAVLIVMAVFFVTCKNGSPEDSRTEKKETSGTVLTQEETGNADTKEDGTEETIADASTGPDVPESTEASSETEAGTTEEATEPVPVTGLRRRFVNKLVVNAQEVELYLNVRRDPEGESEVLSVLYPNDIVDYVGKKGHYYEVQMDGYTGFVNEDYVLTDDAAYDELKKSVAYRAMVKADETYIYQKPDLSSEIILVSLRGDVFRIFGIEGDFYKIAVSEKTKYYDYLYIRREDVLLSYIFLGYGNVSGLSDADADFLGDLDIDDDEIKSKELSEQVEYERQQKYEASVAASSAEASRVEASIQEEIESRKITLRQQLANEQQEAVHIGTFRITHYCHCTQCCHEWGNDDPNYQAYGSSGQRLTEGISVAVDPTQIPYGTKLLIYGHEYIAMDSGVGPFCVDIYHQHHEDCIGCEYVDVYVLPQ